MDNLNTRGSFGSGGGDDNDAYDGSDGSEEQFGSEELSEELSDEFLSEEDEFVDDSMHEGDLEPTDFSESLHVSDLEDDDLSSEPMPEPVEAQDEDNKMGMGMMAAGAAVGVGALGAVLLASKKFSDFLSKDDDNDDGAVEAVSRLQDSMASQSSSSNIAGAAPM